MGKILWEDTWQQNLCDAGMYLGVTAKPALFQDTPGTIEKDKNHAERIVELVSDRSCRRNRVCGRSAGKFPRWSVDKYGHLI